MEGLTCQKGIEMAKKQDEESPDLPEIQPVGTPGPVSLTGDCVLFNVPCRWSFLEVGRSRWL